MSIFLNTDFDTICLTKLNALKQELVEIDEKMMECNEDVVNVNVAEYQEKHTKLSKRISILTELLG
jgi:septum formation topological specificity factor MinE